MQCLISLQMAGTPCWCCIDGWDLHSKLWRSPSRFCPSLLIPGCLPTLPNAELGQDWLVLHRSQPHKNIKTMSINWITGSYSQTQEKTYFAMSTDKPWNMACQGAVEPPHLEILEPCWLYAVGVGCLLGRAAGPDHVQRLLLTTLMHWFHEPK